MPIELLKVLISDAPADRCCDFERDKLVPQYLETAKYWNIYYIILSRVCCKQTGGGVSALQASAVNASVRTRVSLEA